MNKSFILKLATGLWWTVPFAFICKLAVKASHPNLSAAIGEYIEGCLWAVAALVVLQLAIRLGLALWVTIFGPVESPNKAHDRAAREQCPPTPKADPCVESIEELAQVAADGETLKGTTEEIHEGPSKVVISFVPDDEETEVEPEFV